MSKSLDAARTGELCAILMRHFPDARPRMLAAAVMKAQRAALSAKRQAEAWCNYGGPDDEAYAGLERRRAKKEAALALALREACALAPRIDDRRITVELGGDPRGACGWVYVRPDGEPPLRGDGFGCDAGFPLY